MQPAGTTDEQVHLMVQVSEAWLLTDRQLLRDFYDGNFREQRLPGNPDIEKIAADDVLLGLRLATRETPRGEYHKMRHGPELIGRLSAAALAAASPSAKRLLDTVRRVADP